MYEPAEDSGLLADAAVDALGGTMRVLEVGTGSGYVAARVREEVGATVYASDLNPHACRRAAARGLPVVRADLLDPFRAAAFDAVLFNPPYLPDAGPVPEDGGWLEVAVSGGETGRAVVGPFLDDVGRVLRPGGVVLLLASSLADVDAVEERAAANGLAAEPVAEAVFPFETLVVLRLRPV